MAYIRKYVAGQPLDQMSNEDLKRVANEATARLDEAVSILERRAKKEARPKIPRNWEFFTFTIQFTHGGTAYHYVARQREDGQVDVSGRRFHPFQNSEALMDWIEENSAVDAHIIRRLLVSLDGPQGAVYWTEKA